MQLGAILVDNRFHSANNDDLEHQTSNKSFCDQSEFNAKIIPDIIM